MSHGPLIQAYLADLRHSLSGLPEDEREDVLSSITEHIQDRMAANPRDPAAATKVLEQLGPVERIAAEAGANQTHRSDHTQVAPAPAPNWAGPLLIALASLSLILVLFMPLLAVPLAAVTLVTAIYAARRHPNARHQYRTAAAIAILTLVVAVIMAATLLPASTTNPTPSPPVTVSESPSP